MKPTDPLDHCLSVTSTDGTTKLSAHPLTRAEAIETAKRFNEDPTDTWTWSAGPIAPTTPTTTTPCS